ncbi:acyltransferase [Bacteroides ovatus]|nr:acyltransferase [Bacteroides ovatus]
MMKKIVNIIKMRYYTSNSERYIAFLKKKGIKIGRGTIIRNPRNFNIDITRPELIEIGDDVLLHSGMTILTHDYASRAFVNLYASFIPSHAKVIIGNNVWFGENVTVLKGVEIGDNVIIGYGAVVTKSIPSNSVAVGFPAKVIGTFEDYYKKRKKQYVNECFEYVQAIINSGRNPTIEDLADDYPIFVDGSNYQEYPYPYYRVFDKKKFEIWKRTHKAIYHGYDEFMNAFKRWQNNEF